MLTDTPIHDALIDAHPDVPTILARPRWNYADALKAADEAIAALAKKPARKKPAAKRTQKAAK